MITCTLYLARTGFVFYRTPGALILKWNSATKLNLHCLPWLNLRTLRSTVGCKSTVGGCQDQGQDRVHAHAHHVGTIDVDVPLMGEMDEVDPADIK